MIDTHLHWQTELEYIAELLLANGDSSVPFESIGSYLRTQAVGAKQVNLQSVSKLLKDAADLWAADAHTDALNRVFEAQHCLAQAGVGGGQ